MSRRRAHSAVGPASRRARPSATSSSRVEQREARDVGQVAVQDLVLGIVRDRERLGARRDQHEARAPARRRRRGTSSRPSSSRPSARARVGEVGEARAVEPGRGEQRVDLVDGELAGVARARERLGQAGLERVRRNRLHVPSLAQRTRTRARPERRLGRSGARRLRRGCPRPRRRATSSASSSARVALRPRPRPCRREGSRRGRSGRGRAPRAARTSGSRRPGRRRSRWRRRTGMPTMVTTQNPPARVPKGFEESESGREDLNLRPPGPEPGALPGCATPRQWEDPGRAGVLATRRL